MTTETATPGPWYAWPSITRGVGYLITTADAIDHPEQPESTTDRIAVVRDRADAVLMAEAPNLLAALEAMCCPFEDTRCNNSLAAQNAAAKARGQ